MSLEPRTQEQWLLLPTDRPVVLHKLLPIGYDDLTSPLTYPRKAVTVFIERQSCVALVSLAT
jgi:hypothetical protein